MRKIIQLLYDHQVQAKRIAFIALCDDGSVWRQRFVADGFPEPYRSGAPMIVEPIYHTEWERIPEFDQIPTE